LTRDGERRYRSPATARPTGGLDPNATFPTKSGTIAAGPKHSSFANVARSLGESDMRIAENIVGAVLVFFGGVWFLQGINVLPGSFMTGQMKWAVYGGVAFVAGLVLLILANRKRKAQPPAA
jgi:hypothetical protein